MCVGHLKRYEYNCFVMVHLFHTSFILRFSLLFTCSHYWCRQAFISAALCCGLVSQFLL